MCGAKVSRCPVTSSTLLSILQNRSIFAQWRGRVASSLSAPNHTSWAAQGREARDERAKDAGYRHGE